MFVSNHLSPLVLNSGTWHDAAIALKDAIVGMAGSPWAEVTGAGPTPAWLQPYASTAIPGQNSTTNGFAYHTTLYLTTDPGLAAAGGNPVNGTTTPHCRLIRFVVYQYAVVAQVIDTLHANPATTADWLLCASTTVTTTGIFYSQPYGAASCIIANYGQSSTTNPFGTLTVTVKVFQWEDFLAIRCFNSGGNDCGGGMFFFPDSTPGDQRTRAQIPFMWVMNALDNSYTSSGSWGPIDWDDVGHCKYLTNGPSYNSSGTTVQDRFFLRYELGSRMDGQDGQNREYIQRMILMGDQPDCFMWGGFINHYYTTRQVNHVGSGNIKTIGSDEYYQMKVASGSNGDAHFLKLADNNA